MKMDYQLVRRLRLRDLHYLLTTVQTGSMAKAANVLLVSQPVISKVIADMEQTLGERVLDRSPRGVEPTVYGRKLIDMSFAVFDELRHGVIEIEHLLDPGGGEIAIGSNEAATLGIIPAAIKAVRRNHPGLFAQVILMNSPAEQHQALARREIDFSIGRVWSSEPAADVEVEILYDEQFTVLSGPDNPWRSRSHIELSELMDRPWILPPRQNLSGQNVIQVFQRLGLTMPYTPVHTSSIQLTLHLLERTPYLAMLPNSVLSAVIGQSEIVALPVSIPDVASPMGIVKLRDRKLSPIAEVFLDAVRQASRALPIREKHALVHQRPVSELE